VIDPARLSLNLITVDHWSLEEAVERCAAAGIGWVAPWRHQLSGATEAARLIGAAGLRVSSLCRGGFFTSMGADEDNRRAVDEAAELGAQVLVLVCGPPPGKDLAQARDMIAAGIDRLLPYAAERGVRLGIEPLHPMMIGKRSAIVTLGEANDLVERLGAPHLGVVIDVYHVFWDPRLEDEIARAGGHIFGFHVCDWLAETTDTINERGMMGDGIIDLPRVRTAVEAAGYDGLIEVEIINPAVWGLPRGELMSRVRERFARCV